MIGQTLAHYVITAKLGEGGMGEVYRARDPRLDREVALKLLPPHLVADPERRERLAQEARAASALNHPNIVTIYDIGRAPVGDRETDFIAMELVDGEPLDRRIEDVGLSIAEAVGYAVEAASALAVAHDAGIVHRDLKPSNLMINRAGRLKILDFGLAKLGGTRGGDQTEAPTLASPVLTRQGVILGTPVYMSPEQAAGRRVDARSDVYSLGLVLYEMLAGRRCFPEGLPATVHELPPPSVRAVRSEVPEDLERIVGRCLEPDPAKRYPTAAELEDDLRLVAARLAGARIALADLLHRPRFLIAAAGLLLALAAGGWWFWQRGAQARWGRDVALPEIERLLEEDELAGAYRLAREAERRIPDDARLTRLWERFALPASIRTEPAGAEVFTKVYLAVDEPWESLGRTPIEAERLPNALLRFRFEKEGYETLEIAPTGDLDDKGVLIEATLWPPDPRLADMVRIPAGSGSPILGSEAPIELDLFWIDRYEVSNNQFQEFVKAGGYRRREFWEHTFSRHGEELGWEQAMALFRDPTGRPGPATWELGTYAEGQGDLPVGGLSWFEAAAYAKWAGKSLPTVHHWYRAAEPSFRSEIVLSSNFTSEAPTPVGGSGGLGPYGTYDMAGNVKEWSLTATGDKRYLLGGSWNDPTYLYTEAEADSPFAREPTHGVRCVLYPQPLPAAQMAPIASTVRDYRQEEPVSDEIFTVLEGVYAYDKTPLDARVETDDDSAPHWRLEKISVAAAYGDERVPAYLFLPKNASPPYQTVIYFPSSLAEALGSSEHLELRWFDFLVRSGRAVIHPVYKGTFERGFEGGPTVSSTRRDLLIQWAKDIGRTLDYLETRPEFDSDAVAFYGFSLGAVYGPILTAVEERFQAAIYLGGGLTGRQMPPEGEILNFAPRVHVPVLMISGRDDFVRPVELAQRPLLERFATPEEHKRLAVLPGGHLPVSNHGVIREILDWLDRYLGPVDESPSPQGAE